jgi:signal transduction histidine kinase/CheY-like chemotaxis protein
MWDQQRRAGRTDAVAAGLDPRIALVALASHANDYMCVLAEDGSVVFANHETDTRAEALHHAGLRDAIARVRETGQTAETTLESTREGVMRAYAARVMRAPVLGVPHVLLYVRDVTPQRDAERALATRVRELEQAQRQMTHAQKLQSMSRLAGGVAHDFNNLLTAIISFTRFVMDDLGTEDPRRSDLAEALKAADGAAKLTRQLLAFARTETSEPILVELNGAVGRLERILRRTLDESIELRVIESATAVQVKCDPGQLERLLINLAVNAADAMPSGGTLSIEVGLRAVHRHGQLADGDYAAIGIADTGCGMTAEVMASLFEPYFTTKREPSAGLGLATCYGIARQAQGHIDVESRPGVGSKFTLLLPLAREVVQHSPASARVQIPRLSRQSVTLLVEDQDAVRRSMKRSLERAGFNVIDASSAEEALGLLEDLAARVDLLITDVVLPGIDGVELARRLRDLHPELRVLICSAYSGTADREQLQAQPHVAFLPKPLTGEDLVSRAAAMLTDAD